MIARNFVFVKAKVDGLVSSTSATGYFTAYVKM